MIDIIIPIYNSKSTLEKALLSIMFQSIKDQIKVYIIDDCSKEDCSDILDKFKNYLNITYYKNEKNLGPGSSRQKGLELSNSKFVMFLDSDDLFYTHNSIEELFSEIEKNNYDYVSSITYNEKSNTENSNIGDLHGKIYSRAFLNKNKIAFNELRYDEDNYFNTLVLMNNPTTGIVNKPTYIYKNNESSVTNCKTNNSIYYVENYVNSIKKAVQNTTNNKSNHDVVKSILSVKLNYLENIKSNYDLNDQLKIENWIKDLKNLYQKFLLR